MQTILLVSTRPGAGKTTIAAGLGELFRRDGRSVGYVKALELGDAALANSADARFMAGIFGGPGFASAALGHDAAAGIMSGKESQAESAVAALRSVGEGKDVFIVEGPSGLHQGISLGVSPVQLASALDASVIVVARYLGDEVIDDLLAAKVVLGERLLGVVIQAVPEIRFDSLADRLGGFLARHEIKLLGAIPHYQPLQAVTVSRLAEHLGGKIMNSEDHADRLVESFMVGTVVLGKASEYFRKRQHKAVIAHGSRPDVHLAALETDTRCIVLAGNVVPNPIVLARAEEESVPLIMVKQDTLAVLDQIEELFPTARFGESDKVVVAAELVERHVNLTGIRLATASAR